MKKSALILIVILLGCATPEKLIDRAVKKDPTILTHTTDTIREILTVVDSFPVLSVELDTLYFEKVIKTTEFITVNNNQGIEIERKKTRQEVRKSSRLELRIQKDSTIILKLQKENEKLEIKLKAKNENKADRRDNKNENKADRRQNSRSNWFWFGYILGLITIILLFYVLWRLKKITTVKK